MIERHKYDFSFTAASLRLNEMILVANATLDKRDIDFINELGAGKSTTGKRMFAEFNKRISKLSELELRYLVDADLVSQKQIAFLSVCKAYGFIRDFVIEVLREKMMVFDDQITEGDYISFLRRKQELHPELEKITEITISKIKQVTFKILEQAGIIDNIKSKKIQPQLLDFKVIKAILSDNPIWLKIFLMSDTDIASIEQ